MVPKDEPVPSREKRRTPEPRVPFTLHLSPELRERLARAADERGEPAADVVRAALAAYLDREEKRGGRP
jgi:ribbon-helix-helix CopG family protein